MSKRKELLKELKKFRFSTPEATNLFSICILIEKLETKYSKLYLSKKISPEKYVEYKNRLFMLINNIHEEVEQIEKFMEEKNGLWYAQY